MNDVSRPQSLIGTDIFDRDGARIGRVGNVYVDDATHEPEWVTVRTGLFGLRESFVPLTGASARRDRIKVGVSKDKVREAPRIDAEHGHLSDEQGQGLYDHYGIRGSAIGLRADDEETAVADAVPAPRGSRPPEAIEAVGEPENTEPDDSEPDDSGSDMNETSTSDEDSTDEAGATEKVGAAAEGGRHHRSESTPARYRVSGSRTKPGRHRKEP